MSETEISQELTLATELFDLSLADIEKITVNAVKDSFASYHDRVDLIYRSILSTVAILFAAGLAGIETDPMYATPYP